MGAWVVGWVVETGLLLLTSEGVVESVLVVPYVTPYPG